jgi:hypothetical protein
MNARTASPAATAFAMDRRPVAAPIATDEPDRDRGDRRERGGCDHDRERLRGEHRSAPDRGREQQV